MRKLFLVAVAAVVLATPAHAFDFTHRVGSLMGPKHGCARTKSTGNLVVRYGCEADYAKARSECYTTLFGVQLDCLKDDQTLDWIKCQREANDNFDNCKKDADTAKSKCKDVNEPLVDEAVDAVCR